MNINYHRDLNHNYLILSDLAVTGKEYPLRMLAENRIPGFLELSVRLVNGEYQLFYEITSKVSVSGAYETRKIGRNELETMIGSIADALRQAGRYLIGTEHIPLDPDMLYMDPDTGKVSVLLLPCSPENKEGMTQIQILAEFILRRLDHEDRAAVNMGYAFYRMAGEDRYGFEAIEETLRGQKKQDTPAEDPVLRDLYGSLRRDEAEEDNERSLIAGNTDSHSKKKSDKRREKEKRKEERKAEKKRRRMEETTDEQVRRKIIFWICVVTGSLIVYVLLLLVFRLDLTQAGGLAFLMISVGWLIAGAVDRKRKEGKNHWSDDVGDEDELMEALMEELYEQESKKQKEEQDLFGEQAGFGSAPGKTRALVADDVSGSYVLVSQDPRRYKDIAIYGASIVIGKSPELAQAVIDHDAVSRIHAKVECMSGTLRITDLNSMNGVSVNGKTLIPMKPCEIKEDDMIGIADLRYRVRRRG